VHSRASIELKRNFSKDPRLVFRNGLGTDRKPLGRVTRKPEKYMSIGPAGNSEKGCSFNPPISYPHPFDTLPPPG